MQKREIIATLLTISNELDSFKMYEDADVLTRAAQTLDAWGPTDPEFNPDDMATVDGFLGEERYEREQQADREFRNEEALMALEARLSELQTKPNPTLEDIEEFERLMKYRYGPDFDENNVQYPMGEEKFVQALENAGADIQVPDENDPFANE